MIISIRIIWKVVRLSFRFVIKELSWLYVVFMFIVNGVKFSSFESFGFPIINISLKGKCSIGRGLKMHNGAKFCASGINGKCKIDVRNKGELIIGNSVGLSDVTIICQEHITIGNNVLLGVGTQIRDTDEHSLNVADRLNGLDKIRQKSSPIVIGDNVFIGANCMILKGINIGANSIVGAGSVLTKNVPPEEIWAGNPAKFIRKIK
ncbi:acyltransferase [Geofilum sp. OHC36d9]|uniref:acyltransferase n=1 Tax=Geofilum sp. OHC36d9 TaxID=3458413 RepID=UPI004033D499